MTRVPGPGAILDTLIQRFEDLVARLLVRVARAAGRSLGSTQRQVHAVAVSLDDLGIVRTYWVQHLDQELLPALQVVFDQSAARAAGPLREVRNTALAAPSAVEYLAQARNRLVGVGDDLWHQTRTTLTDGIQAGENITQLTARVEDAAQFTEPRARTIARTEVVSAHNAAAIAQVRMLRDPTVVKEWLATPGPDGTDCDARTRPAHCAADGQRVRLGERFVVGEALLDFPGDPTGPPDQVINCRCSPAFDLDDEPLTAAAAAGATATEGVTLPHSRVEVDAWDDGTYTVTLPDAGPQARFTDRQADGLVDALNTVRGAGTGEHQDVAAADGGPVSVAQGKGDDVALTVATTPVTLNDDDAYDLSYQLALWLDRAGFYDRHPAQHQADTVVAAGKKRVWNPDQHPRDPATGRFIGKGLVGRKNGGAAKSDAIPGTSRAPAPVGHPAVPDVPKGGGKAAPEAPAPKVDEPPAAPKAKTPVKGAKAPAKKTAPAKEDAAPKESATGTATPLKKGRGPYRKLKPAQAQAMQDDMLKDDPWTKDQRDAVRTYTGPGFRQINGALRGQSNSDAATDKDIANVRAALRELPQNIVVNRDTDPQSFGFPGKKMTLKQAQSLIGKTFHDKGFISTSTQPRAARQVRMQIDVPQGTRAAYVDSVSENSGEHEVLLADGSHIQITGAEQDDRGDIILHMSLVGQDSGTGATAPSPTPATPSQVPDDDESPAGAALRAGLASGVKTRKNLAGGVVGTTELVTFNDGSQAVRKVAHKPFGGRSPRDLTDAEELGAKLGGVLGAPVPAVVRTGDNEVYMDYVPKARTGASLVRAAGGKKNRDTVVDPLVDTPEGRKLGLLDILSYNDDRHDGNWLVKDGKLVGIDQGLAFPEGQMSPEGLRFSQFSPGPFGSYYGAGPGEWKENDLTQADINWARAQLATLRPAFAQAGRINWLNFAMGRLKQIEPYAAGDTNRLAP